MKTILIVDDEPDVAQVVGEMLDDAGYRVLVATNGIEGLRTLQHNDPDLVICDLMMPFMDGTAMSREVRADPRHRKMAIVMLSVMEEAVIKSEFSDYDGYLRKPFRRVALLDMVRALLDPVEAPTTGRASSSPQT